MADFTDTVSIELQQSTKPTSTGIAKVINDLKQLHHGMSVGTTGTRNLQQQFKDLAVSLHGTKLKSSISSINSDLLRYVTTTGDVITVNRKMKDNVNSYTVSLKKLNKELDNNKNKNVVLPKPDKYGSMESQLSKLGIDLKDSELISTLKDVNSELTKYKLKTGEVVTVQKKLVDGQERVKVSVRNVNKELRDSNNYWKNFSNGISTAILKTKLVYHAVKNTMTTVFDIIDNATAYEEALNLFTVSMGESAKEATQWAEMFSNALYLDSSNVMQYMGSLNSLIGGLGVGAEKSYLMSKNLTQLAYDLASFKNMKFEEAFTKLQSGISGEIEPLRNVGVALSQNTLQELANSLGIKQRVAEMSEEQKAQLRYIQIIKSTTQWQGDMGRTLMTPANALRVAREQFTLLGRAIGQVFLPIVMKSIPYIMALTEVLTDLAKKLSQMLGYEPKAVDYSSLKTMTSTITGIGDEAEKTTDKLNTMLAPFDELNVVQNQSKNAGSGLGGNGGDLGIDLPEYDALAGLTSEFSDNVATAKDNLIQMVPVLKAIGGIIVGYKVIKILGDATQWIGGTGSAIKTIASLFGIGKGSKSVSAVGDSLSSVATTAKQAKKAQMSLKLPKWSTIIKGLGQLGLVVSAVAAYIGILGLITKIPGFKRTLSDGTWVLEEVFTSIARIAIPVAATSVGVVALGSLNWAMMITGLANLATVIIGTEAVILAVGAISKLGGNWLSSGIQAMKDVFNGITSIALPLLAVSAAFSLTGLAGAAGVSIFALGLANFAIIIGGTTALLTAIGGLLSIPHASNFLSTGIDSMKSVFNGLYNIAIPLGLFTAYLLVLGLATPAPILSGLAGFALVVGGLNVVLAALGTLNQIPGFDWIVGEGGKVLANLGNILGKFAGSIVAGFINVATNTLPAVGSDLASFATNAKPFFEVAGNINANTTKGVSNLADALLKITGAGILDALTSWFAGESSLTDFGEDLAKFGPYFKRYADSVKGIDAKVVNNSATAAKSIAQFARELPNQGGMVAWFTGDNTLDVFSGYLPKFGKNMKAYYNNIKDIDSELIENSATAAKSIAQFARELPNQGGMVAWFTGDNTLDVFSKYLPTFGKNIKTYSDNIKGIDAKVVTDSANAAKAIAQFANNLPNQGGMQSWFTGDNKISTFGAELATFGEHFKKYYNQVKSLGMEKINSVSESISTLVNNLKTIKNNGLVNTLKDFGRGMSESTTGIKSFFNNTFNTSTASSIGSTFGKELGKKIKSSLTTSMGTKITLTGTSGSVLGSYNIKAYESGGYPTSGDLFYANENGIPEMIGRIGNQTAVANNDQITTAITNALITALSEYGFGNNQPGTTVINIGGNKVYEGVGDYVDSENDRYGTNYINV